MDRYPQAEHVYPEIEAKINKIKTMEDIKDVRNLLHDMLLKVEEQIVVLEQDTSGQHSVQYEHLKRERKTLSSYLVLLQDKSQPLLASHQPKTEAEEATWIFDRTDKAWDNVGVQKTL